MRITPKLIILFSLVIIITSSSISYFTLGLIQESMINADLEEMEKEIDIRYFQLDNLHARASEDLVFALKNPKFVEYFELPETRAGNIFENDVMQFTDNQREIKEELEQWIYHFQNKFQVDETCIIDATGQEHARLVLKGIEIDEYLSPDEAAAPFFTPSFAKERDEVHIQYPYLSPDTNRWVFAYTSPVVLGDDKKPAFYHFEMPLTIFQDMVKRDHGRMMVIDPQGYIIADSQYDFTNSETVPDFVEYFPSAYATFQAETIEKMLEQTRTEKGGAMQYQNSEGQIHYMVFKELHTFGWILAFEESEELILSEHHTFLGNIQITLATITAVITGIALAVVFVISNRITKPIVNLRNATKSVMVGDFDVDIDTQGNDELSDLSKSFKEMSNSIKKTIELEKELAAQKQKVKSERLSAIGELASRLSHDLRNPLNVIQIGVENLRTVFGESEKTDGSFKRIGKAIDRMTHQIESVLDFVRYAPPQIENYSTNEILESAINMLKIPDTIKINMPSKDTIISCDNKQSEIVFYNLIQNAIQAIDGEDGEVAIRIIEQDNEVLIEFEDSGAGITDDDLKNIFEPLFTTRHTGTGLGLASCKNLMENVGGKITVSTHPTIFTAYFPKKNIKN